MFSNSSVYILGAGTSADFGLPLGNGLFADIGKLLGRCGALGSNGSEIIRTNRGYDSFPSDPLTPLLRDMVRSMRFARYVMMTPSETAFGALANKLRNLRDLLTRSTAETIDEFLTLNPSHAELCKFLIATSFFTRLYSRQDHSFRRSDILARNVGSGQRNWIHLFINIYKTNYLRGKHKPSQPIRIVSFNYDSILRVALDELFQTSERNIGPWHDHFEIYDVYGAFASLPEFTKDPISLISEWAECLRTVDERKLDNDDLSIVRDAVINCDIVYAAGFAFAPDNCELIGLDKRNVGLPLSYLNFDGSVGLKDRVNRYASERSQKPFLPDGNGFSLSRAIAQGLFGEMPM